MTLHIQDLAQGYGRNDVISGINVDVPIGKIVCILGPNGSGKSTLIKTVSNIMTPRKGSVSVDGVNVHEMSPKEISRTIGYVPQKYVPADYMKVIDTILIGRAPYITWSFSDEDFDHADRAIEAMDIGDLAEMNTNELSGGQIQKVLIARALAQDPLYYILDEPTSALDLKNQIVALRTIKNIVSTGKAGALVALHDLNLAMRFTDEVVMLHEGHIFTQGPPEEAITTDSIETVYGVHSEIFKNEKGTFIHIIED